MHEVSCVDNSTVSGPSIERCKADSKPDVTWHSTRLHCHQDQTDAKNRPTAYEDWCCYNQPSDPEGIQLPAEGSKLLVTCITYTTSSSLDAMKSTLYRLWFQSMCASSRVWTENYAELETVLKLTSSSVCAHVCGQTLPARDVEDGKCWRSQSFDSLLTGSARSYLPVSRQQSGMSLTH